MRPPHPHTPPLPAIALIGAGRVGSSLHAALEGGGHPVRMVGRGDPGSALEGARAALLCVPDAEIGSACATLLERRETTAPSLQLVGHTSGASTLEVLAEARSAGLATFSVHPLQTIPTPTSVLTSAPAAVAGSTPAALGLAAAIADAAGMVPFEVPEDKRAAYHAAASIASNFLIALEESAAELLERAGIADARELLAPLVLRTAANWADSGADALTGPIARGDRETVERHRDAIAKAAPELIELYEALAARTRALAGEPTENASEPR